MPDDRQRAPAVSKDITDIDPEQDTRVRVMGTILETRADSLIMDDGTGTVEVFVNEEDGDTLQDGQRIRVLGRVLPTPDGFEIQGEVVQDMTDLDMELYDQVKDRVPRNRMP